MERRCGAQEIGAILRGLGSDGSRRGRGAPQIIRAFVLGDGPHPPSSPFKMKLNRVYQSPADLPRTIPVFPLAGALLLPRRPLPLNVFEPRYLSMVDDALSGERLIGVIQPSAGEAAQEPQPDLYPIGCAGRITQFAETG